MLIQPKTRKWRHDVQEMLRVGNLENGEADVKENGNTVVFIGNANVNRKDKALL